MTDALSYDGFSFAYPGCDCVCDGVDWSVPEGSFTLLVGGTGCGKTTLLRCAKPELAPVGSRGGTVRAFGEDVYGMDVARSAATIGYVAQSPDNQLVCHTVWHEMAFGLESLGESGEEMRRRVAEVAHFFGIEPWFRREVDGLSGGQKQLLNLASVLVMQPRILLLDEPTSQLDPVAQKSFSHALFRLNRELGLTIVVATHSPHQMESYATACVRLEEGKIVPCDKAIYRERPLGRVPSRNKEASEVVVEVSDVHFRYSKSDPFVLRGADISVGKGEVCALVGGNGSGKSTMLRLMAGLAKPSRGRVQNTLSGAQAYLPQNPKALFTADTVEDELMEWAGSCGYGRDEVEEWLARISLATCKGRHPYDLSGGQQQLLAFVKVALTHPRLLLLDEPAKGLDPAAKYLLARMVEEQAKSGTTVVMATHDLAFAACLCDRVSMMFDGQVTCTEPADCFFENNLFYRPVADGFTDMYLSSENVEARS